MGVFVVPHGAPFAAFGNGISYHADEAAARRTYYEYCDIDPDDEAAVAQFDQDVSDGIADEPAVSIIDEDVLAQVKAEAGASVEPATNLAVQLNRACSATFAHERLADAYGERARNFWPFGHHTASAIVHEMATHLMDSMGVTDQPARDKFYAELGFDHYKKKLAKVNA